MAARYAREDESTAIRVIDVVTGRVRAEIPSIPPDIGGAGGNRLLALRFVDDNRKLLTVHAKMGGGYEGSRATASDMQFAIWDLQKRELFNFYRTATRGLLIEYDFLWDFSEESGDLWAVRTDGRYWTRGGKINPIRARAVDLKRCGLESSQRSTTIVSGKLPQHNKVLELAADPLGRWVAITELVDSNNPNLRSRVVVRDSRSGRQLASFDADSAVRSLTPTPDGKVLFGITTGQPAPEDRPYPHFPDEFVGGAKLVRLDLAKALGNMDTNERSEWDEHTCAIEDETDQARNVVQENTRPRQLYQIEVMGRFNDLNMSCYSNESQESPRRWGLSGDGRVWVDQVRVIQEIDAGTGKVVREIKTPRSEAVCSVPWFEGRQFVSTQGDTISLRPFFENAARTDRRIVDRRPGWKVLSALFRGERLVVRWGAAQAAGQEPPPLLAVIYDPASGGVLQQRKMDQSGMDLVDPLDYERLRPPLPHGGYRWELGYFGSVRVRVHDPHAKQTKTILWDGLRLRKGVPRGIDGYREDNVPDLGGGKGAFIGLDRVVLYDALARAKLADVSATNAIDVKWHHSRRLLFIESFENRAGNSDERRRILRAFHVE